MPVPDLRIGYGYDVHQLAQGEEFWLGGIQIPSDIGAVGHSDADVLLHVICDALLGARAMGDIQSRYGPRLQRHDNKICFRRCRCARGLGNRQWDARYTFNLNFGPTDAWTAFQGC